MKAFAAGLLLAACVACGGGKAGPSVKSYTNSVAEREVSYEEALGDLAKMWANPQEEFVVLVRADGATLQFAPTKDGKNYTEAIAPGTNQPGFVGEIGEEEAKRAIRAFFDGEAVETLGLPAKT